MYLRAVTAAPYTRIVTTSKHTDWDSPAILHVDLDAFFAAVEQLDHPEWRGRPVIVGGDPGSRGVVATCSYEARVFGVRSAMPSARAAALCPHAIWTHGHFDRYREVATQVREIFASQTPRVQPVSIDEAYLDVTPGRFTAEDPVAIAQRIRTRIAELGITASVGLSTSKTVSKIASDHDKPDGLTIVRPGEEAAFLAPLPVSAMPGVGPRSAEKLNSLGIHTLGDLARLDPQSALHALGTHGPALVHRARGIDDRSVHENAAAKSVSNERTFTQDVRTVAEVDAALANLCARVGNRTRRAGVAGRTVTVKLRFSDFTTKTVQRTLPEPTDDEHTFCPIARALLESAWTPGVGLRLLGVGLSGFDERAVQLELIGSDTAHRVPQRKARGQRVVRGIDAVRERFGDDAVRYGSQIPRKPSPTEERTSDGGSE